MIDFDELIERFIVSILVIIFLLFIINDVRYKAEHTTYSYIDIDNNKGIADYCSEDMCRIENKHFKVKEYEIKEKGEIKDNSDIS